MRIALAQLAATTDPAANLDLVSAAIAEAAGRGADLVVFPEATMCSFARPRADVAEPFDGPWANQVRELAAAAGVVVVAGMFTATGTARVRNTLLVTGPGLAARYDKLHLFDALGYAESSQIEPGHQLTTFDTGGVTFGLATCYDVRFPALFTGLATAGAQVILLPSSWAPGPDKLHQWRTLVTARSMDSTSFLVAVDQAAAAEPGPTGIGHSMVVDPAGKVLLELGADPELALIDLDPDLVGEVRARLPVLVHARSF